VTADGFRAVPRTHLNLIAGGLALFLEGGVPQGAKDDVGIRAVIIRRRGLIAPDLAAVGGTLALITRSMATCLSSRSTTIAATRWSHPRRWRCDWLRLTCPRACRRCAM